MSKGKLHLRERLPNSGTSDYCMRMMRFGLHPCPRLPQEGDYRRIPSRKAGTWWSPILVNRIFTCNVYGRSPCWRRLSLAERKLLLPFSVAILAGMFRHSRRSNDRFRFLVVRISVGVHSRRDLKVFGSSNIKFAYHKRTLTVERRCLSLFEEPQQSVKCV